MSACPSVFALLLKLVDKFNRFQGWIRPIFLSRDSIIPTRTSAYGERFPRIWMKLGGNSSYKPPGAYHTAQGPQKQPEIIKNPLLIVYNNSRNVPYIPLYAQTLMVVDLIVVNLFSLLNFTRNGSLRV